MEKLFPFCGYRYDLSRVGELGRVVTQPYDKITPDLLQQYLGRSPYNVARVIKNPNYTEAGELFASWIRQGVLRRDPEPGLYPYQQEFELEGRPRRRLGLIGLVSLEGAGQRVKGHENIFRAPLEDRLQLIRRTESNDGLIFSLYSDRRRQVDGILESFCSGRDPVAELLDDHGTRHTLWRLADPDLQQEICRCFRDWTLYIADGHHRFQTALEYSRECRDNGWKPGAVESFDKRMMALFNMESEGLCILPTHRALRDLESFEAARFLERLRGHFRVTEVAGEEELARALRSGRQRLGMVTGQPFSTFLLEPGPRLPGSMDRIQGPARELDVNLLHSGILEPLLRVGRAELASQKHVDYFRDRGELLELLRQGRYQVAFLLNPTRLEQVREISERGERMPQKSTDFFPKLLTGLVFMKMTIRKPDSA